MPVRLGKISTDAKTLIPESIKKYFGDIGPGIIMKRHLWPGNTVIRLLGIEHAETIVVFGCEHQIFHAGIFGGIHPGLRIKLLWIKRVGKRFVIFFILGIVSAIA